MAELTPSQIIEKINAWVTTNGDKQNTGAHFNIILNAIMEYVGVGYAFMGEAPSSAPSPDVPVLYFTGPGSYTGYASSAVDIPDGSIGLFTFNGSTWSPDVIKVVDPVSVSQNTETGKTELLIGDTPAIIVDNEPETGSDNSVKSGGVANVLGASIVSFSGSGTHFIPFDIKSGEKYVFRFRAGNGIITTIKSMNVNDWSATAVEVFNTNSVQVGKDVAIEPAEDAKYLAFYSASNADVIFALKDNIQSQIDKITPVLSDLESKEPYILANIITKGSAAPTSSSSQNINYIKHIRLIAGHRYRFEISAAGAIAGQQLSLKFENSDISTYATISGNLLVNGAWDGSKKTLYYTATEDKFDMILASYCGSITTINTLTCSITDVTADEYISKLDSLERQVQLMGKYTPSSNGNLYGIEEIRLTKGHKYRIDISAASSVSGTQVSLKFAAANGDTIVQLIGNVLSSGTWNGSKKSAFYVAPDDMDGVKCGSYINGITTSSEITVSVTDISFSLCSINDATEIVRYYEQKKKEMENVESMSDLNILFFSDVHGTADEKKNVQRLIELANAISDLDVVINGGDTIKELINPESSAGAHYLEDLNWYNTIVNGCVADVLTCVGNHDAWLGPFQQGVFNWAPKTDIYKLVTKEVVLSGAHNGSPIVQPSDAEANGLCYYYKDYGSIRVIVLNSADNQSQPSGYWDEAQMTWFENVLADAKTNSKAVICVAHCPADLRTATRVESDFTSVRDYTWGYDAILTPGSAFEIVNDFITAGGAFICWLTGHTHYDQLLTPAGYENQLQINIATARFNYHNDGYYVSDINDVSQPSYDCANYIGVDTSHKLLKVYRVGWNMDCGMKKRTVLCYNYANHTLIR